MEETDVEDFGRSLVEDRRANDRALKTRFENIFRKYEQNFDDIGDEIDLATGEIVINNGHIRSMRHEADTGKGSANSFLSTLTVNNDALSGGPSESDSADEGSEAEYRDDARGRDRNPSDEEDLEDELEDLSRQIIELSDDDSESDEHEVITPDETSNLPPEVQILQSIPDTLKSSMLAMQSTGAQFDPGVIDKLMANLNGQIARAMAASAAAKPKIKTEPAQDSTWSFPELPGDAELVEEEAELYRPVLQSSTAILATPGKQSSLWAPTHRQRWATSRDYLEGSPTYSLMDSEDDADVESEDDRRAEIGHRQKTSGHPTESYAANTGRRVAPKPTVLPGRAGPHASIDSDADEYIPPLLPMHEQYLRNFILQTRQDAAAEDLTPGVLYTKQEDELMFDLRCRQGLPWSTIRKHFPGRTSESLLNRFCYIRRRILPDKITNGDVRARNVRPLGDTAQEAFAARQLLISGSKRADMLRQSLTEQSTEEPDVYEDEPEIDRSKPRELRPLLPIPSQQQLAAVATKPAQVSSAQLTLEVQSLGPMQRVTKLPPFRPSRRGPTQSARRSIGLSIAQAVQSAQAATDAHPVRSMQSDGKPTETQALPTPAAIDLFDNVDNNDETTINDSGQPAASAALNKPFVQKRPLPSSIPDTEDGPPLSSNPAVTEAGSLLSNTALHLHGKLLAAEIADRHNSRQDLDLHTDPRVSSHWTSGSATPAVEIDRDDSPPVYDILHMRPVRDSRDSPPAFDLLTMRAVHDEQQSICYSSPDVVARMSAAAYEHYRDMPLPRPNRAATMPGKASHDHGASCVHQDAAMIRRHQRPSATTMHNGQSLNLFRSLATQDRGRYVPEPRTKSGASLMSCASPKVTPDITPRSSHVSDARLVPISSTPLKRPQPNSAGKSSSKRRKTLTESEEETDADTDDDYWSAGSDSEHGKKDDVRRGLATSDSSEEPGEDSDGESEEEVPQTSLIRSTNLRPGDARRPAACASRTVTHDKGRVNQLRISGHGIARRISAPAGFQSRSTSAEKARRATADAVRRMSGLVEALSDDELA